MTLDRYVFRMLLTRTVVAVVVLICLVQVLELLDVTTSILERGQGLAGGRCCIGVDAQGTSFVESVEGEGGVRFRRRTRRR